MGEQSTIAARQASVDRLGDRDIVEEGQGNIAGEFFESHA